MNNSLSSFVIINNSLNAGIDSIDVFVPFVIRLLNIKHYESVSIETICQDFSAEYGLQIPRHPMETILNRMKPLYLYKEGNKVKIQLSEVMRKAVSINFEEENRQYNWLIQSFIDFCKSYPTPVDVTYEEANSLFINFLKNHDIDIIFAACTSEKCASLLPDIRNIEDNDKVFLLNRFVNDLLLRGGPFAEYLINSAVGHKYASVLLYREFSNVRGKGTCSNYYLDVGLLFDITGINDSFRKKAAEDLLALLTEKGANLWIFQHNYVEFMRIIEGTLNWIENKGLDVHRASRALNHFLNEGYGIAEVKMFISQVDTILDNNKIKKAKLLDPNSNQEYQIDRDALKKMILNVYQSNGLFDLEEREETLELDVNSIEYIYKLRRHNIPVNLNHAEHVFLTSNSGLAYASNRFEQVDLSRGFFTIPPVLTDTFVGTFVWIEEPTQLASEFNRIKMISYTNAALAPRANLLSKFEIEVNRAQHNENNPISSETAFLLLSSDLTRKLLADKTLGDPDRITATTPYEILAETKAQLNAEERKKTIDALKALDDVNRNYKDTDKKLKSHISNTKEFIDKVAHISKNIIIGILLILFLVFLLFSNFSKTQNQILRIVGLVISLISGASGVTIVFIGKRFEEFIRNKLTKILIK